MSIVVDRGQYFRTLRTLTFVFTFFYSDEDQDGRLTRIEMLQFSRAVLSCIFAVSEANCVALDDVGDVEASSPTCSPTLQQKQIAANFAAVKFVALIFSQVNTDVYTSVSFVQWCDWLNRAVDGTSGRWLATVLECVPLK